MAKGKIDWRDVGKAVAERLVGVRRNEVVTLKDMFPEETLCGALVWAAQGDTAGLIQYLLSDKEFLLSREDRERLAHVLQHAFWKTRRGRPRNYSARIATARAQTMYSYWKNAKKQLGVSDWGVRDQMKDECCRFGINSLPATKRKKPSFETVRQLMERPLSRQGGKTPPK